MEIMVTRVWSTPSNLHLRCVVFGKDRKWSQFSNVVVPLDDITEALLPWVNIGQADSDVQAERQDPLF